MISDSEFFMIGNHPSSTYDLHFYKFTFLNANVDWANILSWASGTWSSSESESVLSSDNSKIYSFFIFGSTRYLYFATFAVSNGNVLSSRYKSNIGWAGVYGSASNGNSIMTIIMRTTYSLLIFDTTTSSITIKDFIGDLYGWTVDTSSGRWVLN